MLHWLVAHANWLGDEGIPTSLSGQPVASINPSLTSHPIARPPSSSSFSSSCSSARAAWGARFCRRARTNPAAGNRPRCRARTGRTRGSLSDSTVIPLTATQESASTPFTIPFTKWVVLKRWSLKAPSTAQRLKTYRSTRRRNPLRPGRVPPSCGPLCADRWGRKSDALVEWTRWSNRRAGPFDALVRSKRWSNRRAGQIDALVKSTRWSASDTGGPRHGMAWRAHTGPMKLGTLVQ